MNPLQTHPELFANGQFQAMHPDEDYVYDITGYDHRSGVFFLLGKHDHRDALVKDCQLIARPIEDMSDEEKEEYKSLCQKSENHNAWWDDEYSYIETIDAFLYALSVGCLPRRFEDHFGDTVIDTRTLTNE